MIIRRARRYAISRREDDRTSAIRSGFSVERRGDSTYLSYTLPGSVIDQRGDEIVRENSIDASQREERGARLGECIKAATANAGTIRGDDLSLLVTHRQLDGSTEEKTPYPFQVDAGAVSNPDGMLDESIQHFETKLDHATLHLRSQALLHYIGDIDSLGLPALTAAETEVELPSTGEQLTEEERRALRGLADDCRSSEIEAGHAYTAIQQFQDTDIYDGRDLHVSQEIWAATDPEQDIDEYEHLPGGFVDSLEEATRIVNDAYHDRVSHLTAGMKEPLEPFVGCSSLY